MISKPRGNDVSAGASGSERPQLHGRRRGRRLRPGRQRLIETLLPRLRVPLGSAVDPFALFTPHPRAVWLEIGFGGGEHLAAQAAAHPDIGFIGCEPYVNGVAALLAQVEERKLSNVRVHDDDARPLIAALADDSIERVFVLFPDPWPKKRQHKRRLIRPATLDALARVMRGGGELRAATDDGSYLAWILEHGCRHPSFEWLAEGPRDWRERLPDWPETRYEAKARAAGRPSAYLRFRRQPRRSAAARGAERQTP